MVFLHCNKKEFPQEMNRKSINLDKLYEECKSIYGDEYDLSRIKTYGYDKKYEIEIF